MIYPAINVEVLIPVMENLDQDELLCIEKAMAAAKGVLAAAKVREYEARDSVQLDEGGTFFRVKIVLGDLDDG